MTSRSRRTSWFATSRVGAEDAPHVEQPALDHEHLAQAAAVGVALEHPILQLADAVRQPIDLGEVAVDGRVQHRVQQLADAAAAETLGSIREPPPNTVQHRRRIPGDGQQPSGTDEQVNLG